MRKNCAAVNVKVKDQTKKEDGKCDGKMETYSRVVGYFRPVQNWNKGKQHEFFMRVPYDINKAIDVDVAKYKETSRFSPNV